VIALVGGMRVMVATRPVDFRRGAEGLAALVREEMKSDPFSRAVYVFRAKRFGRRAETLPEDQLLLGFEEVKQTAASDEARRPHRPGRPREARSIGTAPACACSPSVSRTASSSGRMSRTASFVYRPRSSRPCWKGSIGAQSPFAAARVLTRHQAKPCREVAT
jgi:IS66 Orf2 like protein/Transposase C of IS166 homeodomain